MLYAFLFPLSLKQKLYLGKDAHASLLNVLRRADEGNTGRASWYAADMKLVSWNVNGIRSIHRKGMLTPFMDKMKPDIACFQETKAEPYQSEVDLPEYDEYWNSSSVRKGYAGTAIFTKIKPLSVILGFPPDILGKYALADGYGDPNAEGRLITAEFRDFFVVNVYTPNAKPDLSRLELRYKHWDPAFWPT